MRQNSAMIRHFSFLDSRRNVIELSCNKNVFIFFIFSFHPSLPLLATTSGQRQFKEPGNDSDNEETMDQDVIQVDNSLRIWAAGEYQ